MSKLWQKLAIATNWPVLVSVAVLSALGIISIWADNPKDGLKQLVFLGVAVACMTLFQGVNYLKIGRYAWALYVLSLLLVLYTVAASIKGGPNPGPGVHPLPGVGPVKGAYAWITFGPASNPVSVEPAELCKFAFVMVLGRYLRFRSNYRTLGGLLVPFGLALLPMILILKQPDLGMALLFLPALFVMLFVAGARIRHLLAIAAIGIVIAPIAFFSGDKQKGVPLLSHFPQLVKPYQRDRVYSYLHSIRHDSTKLEAQSTDYQTHRTLTAIASGGWSGKGFGEIPIGYSIPEVHNDMILALVGEQFGFWGAMALLVAYLVLFAAGIEIAAATREPFGRLVAVGVVAVLAAQSFFNLLVATGLMPVTGITLPFVSYGGSSLVASFMAAGLLLNIGQNRPMVMARESFEFN
jgi:cell division protein FtsW (lipid II flippase)